MKIVEQVPEYIRSLIPYEPGKPIEEVEREYGISLGKLASNENPLGPSPKALAAIREQDRLQLNLYPDGDCFYLKQRFGEKARCGARKRLIFGNGSNEIIELAVRTFMRAGDEAVMARAGFRRLSTGRPSRAVRAKTVPLARLHP